MADAFAVYSTKPSVTGKQLAAAATDDGIQLRFLSLGGGIPADPSSFQRSLRLAGSGALLLVGAFESDRQALKEFDHLVETRDRTSLAKMLNAGQLPWVELMTSAFNYETHLKKFPKDKATLDKAVSSAELADLKLSKIRYIVFNQSKSTRGRELLKRLTSLLAAKSNGVIARHSKPKR